MQILIAIWHRLRCAIVVLPILTIALFARAHGIAFPKQDRLEISPGRLVLTLHYDIEGGRQALNLHDRFDRDSDGLLSEREMEAAKRHLAVEARRSLMLKVNGAAPVLQVTALSGWGLDKPAHDASALGVDVVLETALTSAPLTIEFSDHHSEPGHPVTLQADVRGFKTVHASSGRREAGSAAAVQFRGIYLEPGIVWRLEIK